MRTIHHVCIQTNDYKASLEFYTRIEQNNFMIELQTGKKGEVLIDADSKSKGLVHMCFLVENVQQEVQRILGLGYTHFKLKNNNKIYEVEGSSLSKVIAPEGTIIELRAIAEL